MVKLSASPPLLTEDVPVDGNCVGVRWSPKDEAQLARLVAIVAMGQAAYAAHILKELLPATPAFTNDDLCREAQVRLTLQEDGATPRKGYPRWHRDGFIFEVISWVAARLVHGEHVLLKDPHVSATSQGLDGLMIELAEDKAHIVMTTIFEDKCSDNPRDTFREKVIPAFLERHRNEKSAELVASASALLGTVGIDPAAAAVLAAAVMDRKQRSYRAAFALSNAQDSQKERQRLFKGFDALDGLTKTQRVGASLIVNGEMRDWFDALAGEAVGYLEQLRAAG